MQAFIREEIRTTRLVIEKIESDAHFMANVIAIAKQCIAVLQSGGKILFAGNGGSAADAQHLSAELVSRLRYDRPGLAAIALTTDTSALTAIGNDYAFDQLFSRQIEAIGRPEDLFVGISTSGKSPNILTALRAAKQKGMLTVGFTGKCPGQMAECCDMLLCVPSSVTPKIQECHIMLGHIVCSLVEEAIHGAQYNPARQQEAEMLAGCLA